MKFSIIAAVLATVSSAAPLVLDGQQPLPKRFSLTFTSDSPKMVGTPATVVVDRNGVCMFISSPAPYPPFTT